MFQPQEKMINKRRIILLFLVLFSIALVSSCIEHEVVIDSLEKELFLETENDGFYKGGVGIIVFDESHHQKSYNLTRNTFRIQSDNQDIYFNAAFESLPKNKGVNIITQITYYSQEEEKNSKLLLECSKIDGRRLWFWDSNDKIGIIVSSSN